MGKLLVFETALYGEVEIKFICLITNETYTDGLRVALKNEYDYFEYDLRVERMASSVNNRWHV